MEVESLFFLMPYWLAQKFEIQWKLNPLLEDPHGVTDQLDQFLGSQIYMWAQPISILGLLLSQEERTMIRRAAMTS
jgi:hypothetical protein